MTAQNGTSAAAQLAPTPEAALSREQRVKALACTAPLHDLQAGRGKRGGFDWTRYDCLELGLAAIDLVVDKMGFESGADRDYLEDALADEAAVFAPQGARDEHEAVANTVIEILIRPMRTEYSSADSRRRWFDYRLLEEVDVGAGIFLRATNEAINVLIGALDADIESAQHASEAKLANLIKRRRLPEAEAAARAARVLSISYGQEVRRVIAETRRDLRRAGWDGDTPKRLREMLEHLADRLDAEAKLLAAMRADRDVAVDEPLRAQAASLVATVEDCLNRHQELHSRLMGAQAAFFEEDDRQGFRGALSERVVDLVDELLLPLLGSALADAETPLVKFAELAWGVADRRAMSVEHMLDMLLAEPRDLDTAGPEIPSVEFDDDPEARAFPGSCWDAVEGVLAAFVRAPDLLDPSRSAPPVRLSVLLVEAHAAGGERAAELLRLLAVAATAPALSKVAATGAPVLVAAADRQILNDLHGTLPDLFLGWAVPDPAGIAAAAHTTDPDGNPTSRGIIAVPPLEEPA